MGLVLYAFLLSILCIYAVQNDKIEEHMIHVMTSPLPSTQQITLTQAVVQSFMSLPQLCKMFDIPEENCTCDIFEIPEDSDTLCKYSENNDTVSEVRLIYVPKLSIPVGAVALVASVYGIFGNAVVIGVVMRIGRNLSRCKQIIGTLAVSDLIFSVWQLVLSIPLLWTNKWIYGGFLCKILRGGKVTGEFLYIGFVLILAIERFLTIVKKGPKISPFKIKFALAINVIIALMTVTPLLILYDVTNDGRCDGTWKNMRNNSTYYDWLITVVYFIIPLWAIVTLLSKSMEELNKQSRITKITFTSAHCNITEKRINENKQMIKIIFGMLIAYAICILPNRLVSFYLDFYIESIGSKTYITLCYVGLITYSILIAVNPTIYFIIDYTWRENMKEIILCRNGLKSSSHKQVPSDQDGYTITKRTFGPIMDNIKITKDEKGRNLSIDQGTHLLSYNPSYIAMQKNVNEEEKGQLS